MEISDPPPFSPLTLYCCSVLHGLLHEFRPGHFQVTLQPPEATFVPPPPLAGPCLQPKGPYGISKRESLRRALGLERIAARARRANLNAGGRAEGADGGSSGSQAVLELWVEYQSGRVAAR